MFSTVAALARMSASVSVASADSSRISTLSSPQAWRVAAM
jgi:hypothetical protein